MDRESGVCCPERARGGSSDRGALASMDVSGSFRVTQRGCFPASSYMLLFRSAVGMLERARASARHGYGYTQLTSSRVHCLRARIAVGGTRVPVLSCRSPVLGPRELSHACLFARESVRVL